MFTDTEIALMNRDQRDVNRITNKYQAIVDDLRGTIRIWENTAADLHKKGEDWVRYARKLAGRIENAQKYMKKLGLSEA